jgi:hypothetical protein
MLVQEPMRPGWPESLHYSHSVIPYERLLSIDERFANAAAKPVIIPETINCDRGRVYLSDTFMRACVSLGISVQPSRPYTGSDDSLVERTFASVNTLFCQHVAGYTGRDTTRRGPDAAGEAIWTVAQLQELFDEWVITCWQNRPHEGLSHTWGEGRDLSPNEMYADCVGLSGYIPLPLTGDDYLELLPAVFRVVNDYGITIDNRTYDDRMLNPYRRLNSGLRGAEKQWEVHYDPLSLPCDNGSYADLCIIPMFAFFCRQGLSEIGIMQASVSRAPVRRGCRGSQERCRWAGSVPVAVRSPRCGQEPVP